VAPSPFVATPVATESDAGGWDAAIDDAFAEAGLDLADAATGDAATEASNTSHVTETFTIGHGAGTGGPGGFVWNGRLGDPRRQIVPRIRQGATSVNGRLPPEVIQRIVHQKFDRFLGCYKEGLKSNPSLQGRVQVKFVIDREGNVSVAADGGSDIPDQGVTQCVVRLFGTLRFPQPEGGIVTVVYPLMFNPGD